MSLKDATDLDELRELQKEYKESATHADVMESWNTCHSEKVVPERDCGFESHRRYKDDTYANVGKLARPSRLRIYRSKEHTSSNLVVSTNTVDRRE